jgi:hypothetical protein
MSNGNFPARTIKARGYEIQQFTISFITNYKAETKMKPPAAQQVCDEKLGTVDWRKVWRARLLLALPRGYGHVDANHIHRNLYVAKHGGWSSNTCRARRCQHVENQEHLVSCPIISSNGDFWEEVMKYMQDLNMYPVNTPKYWILGLRQGKQSQRMRWTSLLGLGARSMQKPYALTRMTKN